MPMRVRGVVCALSWPCAATPPPHHTPTEYQATPQHTTPSRTTSFHFSATMKPFFRALEVLCSSSEAFCRS